MVSLKLKTGRLHAVNLPHAIVCPPDECLCGSSEHRSLDLNPKTGEVAVRIKARQINPSVHFVPGEWSEPLPESALNVPAIAALVASRKVDVRQSEPASE